MERDALRELACAWWAFFIASQVLAFPGFGLPSRDMQEIMTKTEPLLRNKMVFKAIRFAVAAEEARPAITRSRMSLALLRDMVAQNTEELPSEPIRLVLTAARVEAYLEKKIGSAIWRSLGRQSRTDLIEADEMWVRAAPDYGAGRADWGALVALYSRRIEAEVRTHLGPLLKRLGDLGLCDIREPTLGGCVQGIRDAKKALKTVEGSTITEEDKARVDRLSKFFVENNGFIESFRNRAAHADREKPITPEEFLRWRKAIFDNQLFEVVLGV
jgi:hypothetical protein